MPTYWTSKLVQKSDFGKTRSRKAELTLGMKQYNPKTQSKKQFTFTNTSHPKEVNATDQSTRHLHYNGKYFILEVQKMFSLLKYSVGFTVFDVTRSAKCKGCTTQLKKASNCDTLEDCLKNQDEKLAHFKSCKQDTIQLFIGIQKYFFIFTDTRKAQLFVLVIAGIRYRSFIILFYTRSMCLLIQTTFECLSKKTTNQKNHKTNSPPPLEDYSRSECKGRLEQLFSLTTQSHPEREGSAQRVNNYANSLIFGCKEGVGIFFSFF